MQNFPAPCFEESVSLACDISHGTRPRSRNEANQVRAGRHDGKATLRCPGPPRQPTFYENLGWRPRTSAAPGSASNAERLLSAPGDAAAALASAVCPESVRRISSCTASGWCSQSSWSLAIPVPCGNQAMPTPETRISPTRVPSMLRFSLQRRFLRAATRTAVANSSRIGAWCRTSAQDATPYRR